MQILNEWINKDLRNPHNGRVRMEEMRILMFTRTMAMGGTEKVVLQLCHALRDKVSFIGVMSCGGELVDELEAMGIPHFECPDITRKEPLDFVKIAGKLKKVIHENRVNLVHCHHRMAALYYQMISPHGVRVIATAHNVFNDGRTATRFLYRGMRVAACGGRVYENLVSYYGLPESSVRLIPNSVPDFREKIVPIPEITNCAQGVLKIGFVGRLSEQKGVVHLIDAMSLLVERGIPARCFIVGDGELGEELHNRARSSVAKDGIAFLGRRNDTQNLLAQVDVCAMPSLWEGLPLVLLEAFSVGVPVVATACDGIMDVVRDGENGLLVDAGDSVSLADGLERLVFDSALRSQLGIKARVDYETDYSYEVWEKRYLDFYKEAFQWAG